MGMDKETTDIWVFGKPRTDLTAEQTVAAMKEFRPPDLEPAERERRVTLIDEIVKRRTRDMAIGVEIGLRAARPRKPFVGTVVE